MWVGGGVKASENSDKKGGSRHLSPSFCVFVSFSLQHATSCSFMGAYRTSQKEVERERALSLTVATAVLPVCFSRS